MEEYSSNVLKDSKQVIKEKYFKELLTPKGSPKLGSSIY